jgi:hypothetical protein
MEAKEKKKVQFADGIVLRTTSKKVLEGALKTATDKQRFMPLMFPSVVSVPYETSETGPPEVFPDRIDPTKDEDWMEAQFKTHILSIALSDVVEFTRNGGSYSITHVRTQEKVVVDDLNTVKKHAADKWIDLFQTLDGGTIAVFSTPPYFMFVGAHEIRFVFQPLDLMNRKHLTQTYSFENEDFVITALLNPKPPPDTKKMMDDFVGMVPKEDHFWRLALPSVLRKEQKKAWSQITTLKEWEEANVPRWTGFIRDVLNTEELIDVYDLARGMETKDVTRFSHHVVRLVTQFFPSLPVERLEAQLREMLTAPMQEQLASAMRLKNQVNIFASDRKYKKPHVTKKAFGDLWVISKAIVDPDKRGPARWKALEGRALSRDLVEHVFSFCPPLEQAALAASMKMIPKQQQQEQASDDVIIQMGGPVHPSPSVQRALGQLPWK